MLTDNDTFKHKFLTTVVLPFVPEVSTGLEAGFFVCLFVLNYFVVIVPELSHIIKSDLTVTIAFCT